MKLRRVIGSLLVATTTTTALLASALSSCSKFEGGSAAPNTDDAGPDVTASSDGSPSITEGGADGSDARSGFCSSFGAGGLCWTFDEPDDRVPDSTVMVIEPTRGLEGSNGLFLRTATSPASESPYASVTRPGNRARINMEAQFYIQTLPPVSSASGIPFSIVDDGNNGLEFFVWFRILNEADGSMLDVSVGDNDPDGGVQSSCTAKWNLTSKTWHHVTAELVWSGPGGDSVFTKFVLDDLPEKTCTIVSPKPPNLRAKFGYLGVFPAGGKTDIGLDNVSFRFE